LLDDLKSFFFLLFKEGLQIEQGWRQILNHQRLVVKTPTLLWSFFTLLLLRLASSSSSSSDSREIGEIDPRAEKSAGAPQSDDAQIRVAIQLCNCKRQTAEQTAPSALKRVGRRWRLSHATPLLPSGPSTRNPSHFLLLRHRHDPHSLLQQSSKRKI
jgi:hypothetical protein